MCPDRKTPLWILLCALASLTLAGCDESSTTGDPDPGQQGMGGEGGSGGGAGGGAGGAGGNAPDLGPPPDGPVPVRQSIKSRVRFKGGERFSRDLAMSLDLPRERLCLELGLKDCATEVHLVALGGMEPYRLGIRKPLPVAPATATIAADRIGLHACEARVKADFEGDGEPLIFKDLAGTSGRPEAAVLEAAAAQLYDRLLRRDADPDEIKSLVAFFDEIEADPDDAERGSLARQWALGSCFAVATSLEALFY